MQHKYRDSHALYIIVYVHSLQRIPLLAGEDTEATHADERTSYIKNNGFER